MPVSKFTTELLSSTQLNSAFLTTPAEKSLLDENRDSVGKAQLVQGLLARDAQASHLIGDVIHEKTRLFSKVLKGLKQ